MPRQTFTQSCRSDLWLPQNETNDVVFAFTLMSNKFVILIKCYDRSGLQQSVVKQICVPSQNVTVALSGFVHFICYVAGPLGSSRSPRWCSDFAISLAAGDFLDLSLAVGRLRVLVALREVSSLRAVSLGFSWCWSWCNGWSGLGAWCRQISFTVFSIEFATHRVAIIQFKHCHSHSSRLKPDMAISKIAMWETPMAVPHAYARTPHGRFEMLCFQKHTLTHTHTHTRPTFRCSSLVQCWRSSHAISSHALVHM